MTDRPIADGTLRRRASSRRGVAPDFRAIVDSLQHTVVVTDAVLDPPGPTILYVNPAFTRMTGYAPDEVIGRSPRLLQGPGTDQITIRSIGAALRRGEGGIWKLMNQGRDGAPYWVELRIAPLRGAEGRVDQFVAFQRPSHPDMEWADVAGADTGRDALTGLPDRRTLLAEVQRHLQGRGAGQLCFAYLSIDHFAALTAAETSMRDAVLLGFADILSANLRRSDGLGRLGGEEFGISMPGIRPAEAQALAERLRRSIEAQPIATPAGPLATVCSIGLSMGRPGETLAELVERADSALEAARRAGGNRVVSG
nr:diguanylate cyclase [uncultured Roseococcus sp.]